MHKTWVQCCQEAIERIKKLEKCEFDESDIESNEKIKEYNDTNHWVCARTVMKWFRDFRMNHESFPNVPKHRSLFERIPPIFDCNPDLKDEFISYAKANLVNLNAEIMYDFVHDTLIPKLVEQERKETGDSELTKESVLANYKIKTLHIRTLYKWMECLGFKYPTRRKTYYVDGHERPDNVKYRNEYIKRYLRNERRCFRWIQLPMSEVEELEGSDNLFSRKYGFEYKIGGLTFFEFHVDDHPTFHQRCRNLPFGGHLSVRKREDEKPLILIGQDESIFKQFAISVKQWALPDGSTSVNPKEDGQGVMLSSFVSRDFGYSHDLTADQLVRVNKFRKNKKYIDEDAAVHVHGKNEKKTYINSICTLA